MSKKIKNIIYGEIRKTQIKLFKAKRDVTNLEEEIAELRKELEKHE